MNALLLPTRQFKINKKTNELEIENFQNPWKLQNIMDNIQRQFGFDNVSKHQLNPGLKELRVAIETESIEMAVSVIQLQAHVL